MSMTFDIEYDENPNGIYFTGETVSGRAIIRVDEIVSVKGVSLRVRGKAKVLWDRSDGRNRSQRDRFARDQERYFDTTTDCIDRQGVSLRVRGKAKVFWDRDDPRAKAQSDGLAFDEERYFDTTTDCIDREGSGKFLDAGTHTFSFACPLARTLPPSFEGNSGRIRYEARITIERNLLPNKSYSRGFTVLQTINLNHYNSFLIPARMEEVKHFCCGPCISKPLLLFLVLQKTAYVPGESIDVSARISNQSSTRIKKVHIALNLVALYNERRVKTKLTEKFALAKKKIESITEAVFEVQETFQVPPTPTTCENLCDIISITYEVEVTVRFYGAHKACAVSIPIEIGNIPYVGNVHELNEESMIANLKQGRGTEYVFEYSPLYEEAPYMKSLKPLFRKDKHFFPRFPFYKMSR